MTKSSKSQPTGKVGHRKISATPGFSASPKTPKPPKSAVGIKSRSRVKARGEVFTQPREVNKMCDLCEPDISDIYKKVLEPGCGTGNFLVEILRRKLKNAGVSRYKILIAASNIYGIDIAADNIREARSRLLDVVFTHLKNQPDNQDFLIALETIINHNIIAGDLLEGRRQIFLIDWIPVDEKGFELKRWRLSDIENDRKKSVRVTDFADLKTAILKLDANLAELPSLRPQRKKVTGQISLFENEKNQGGKNG